MISITQARSLSLALHKNRMPPAEIDR